MSHVLTSYYCSHDATDHGTVNVILPMYSHDEPMYYPATSLCGRRVYTYGLLIDIIMSCLNGRDPTETPVLLSGVILYLVVVGHYFFHILSEHNSESTHSH
jgi:hypothetical protein